MNEEIVYIANADPPIYAVEGDTLTVTTTDKRTGKEQVLIDHYPLPHKGKIDTVIVFKIAEGQFGLKAGFGVAMGEKA